MTKSEFDQYVKELESKHLDNDTEYELYNKAFEETYGHPAFDENGNFWNDEIYMKGGRHMRVFTDIEIGDNVIVYDEYAHDYVEHEITIKSKEEDKEWITETNPTGIRYYGEDLTYSDCDDYISLVHEGNFVRFVDDNDRTKI